MVLILKRCMTGEEHWLHMPHVDSRQSNVIFVRGLHRIVSTNAPSQGVPALLFIVPMCRWRAQSPAAVALVHPDHGAKAHGIAFTATEQASVLTQAFTSDWEPEHTILPVPPVDEVKRTLDAVLLHGPEREALDGFNLARAAQPLVTGFVAVICNPRLRLVTAAPQPVGQADQVAQSPHLQYFTPWRPAALLPPTGLPLLSSAGFAITG